MKRALIFAVVLILLTGCAAVAREPDELTLVRVLGVDGADPVVFTAVSGKTGQAEVSRGSGRGNDFARAREAVAWSAKGTELSLTGVSYLLVGEDVDLRAVLMGVLEDADLGASATVWLASGGAASLLDACNDPAADLRLLTLKGVAAPTVAQALAALATDGAVPLPTVSEQDGRIEEWGTVVWESAN